MSHSGHSAFLNGMTLDGAKACKISGSPVWALYKPLKLVHLLFLRSGGEEEISWHGAGCFCDEGCCCKSKTRKTWGSSSAEFSTSSLCAVLCCAAH
jgi:hypothetical protein